MNSQERLLMTVKLLAQAGIMGLANKDLAKALEIGPSMVCRDLEVLTKGSWVEKTPQGNNRLTPEFAKLANSLAQSFYSAKLQLKDDEVRYHCVL